VIAGDNTVRERPAFAMKINLHKLLGLACLLLLGCNNADNTGTPVKPGPSPQVLPESPLAP
jgi:hypothetical protein